MSTIDTLIHAGWIIPVQPDNTCLQAHTLAIQDGKIIDIVKTSEAAQYHANTTVDLSQHALIPGFVNTHTHAAMSLMRGIADDLALMDWLQNHIWPAEANWVDATFVQQGSELAMAEMIRSGTTCFSDMYFFPNMTAEVAKTVGMRVAIGLILIDFPTVWAATPEIYLEKGLDLHQRYLNDPLVSTLFAPHAPYTVSDAPLRQVQALSTELKIPVHIHLHETLDEIQQSMQQYGKRPIARLQDLGLLSPDLLAVHMCNLSAEDIELITSAGVQVVHCPESNLKLASGFCPVQTLQNAGLNVALGTDGAASNNDLDMLSEMRTAALLSKGVAQDPQALPAFEALKMATLNGANALGLGDKIGSLEIGKYADITAIDLNDVGCQPIYDPISQIVYAAHQHQISHVWIAGKPVLQDHQLTTLDTNRIVQQAKHWAEKIQSNP